MRQDWGWERVRYLGEKQYGTVGLAQGRSQVGRWLWDPPGLKAGLGWR